MAQKIINLSAHARKKKRSKVTRKVPGKNSILRWGILSLVLILLATTNIDRLVKFQKIFFDSQKPADGSDIPKNTGDYRGISFQALAGYKYVYNEKAIRSGTAKDQIPEEIKALNNQKVAVQGYMMPTSMEKDKTKSFMLIVNQMACCYGLSPMLNGWIFVTMEEGRNTNFIMDVPVSVSGVLEVGEKVEEDGSITLYRMKGHRVDVPLLAGKKPFWGW